MSEHKPIEFTPEQNARFKAWAESFPSPEEQQAGPDIAFSDAVDVFGEQVAAEAFAYCGVPHDALAPRAEFMAWFTSTSTCDED